MAIAMRTFGSTLSDLQALTNADKGLDYQRANAQDAINQQRLEAFLRLRGQQLQTEAQKNRDAADRAQRMAELIQQNSQFGKSEENAMKRAEMDAQTRREVAKTTTEGRVDPRMFQSFADIQAMNNENLNKVSYAKQLSDARRAALANKTLPMTPEEDAWGPFNPLHKKRVADADAIIQQLDKQAAALGLAAGPDGGYIIPEFNPIPIPDFGRSVNPAPAPTPVPVPVEPVLPLGGGTFRGAGAGSSWADPVPVAPSPVNRFYKGPDGQWVPRTGY